MNVVVLCGGRGTRLGYEGQKCCVPAAGRPFLCWKLDELVRNGATRLHMLVRHEAVEVWSAAGLRWGPVPVEYHFNEDDEPWPGVAAIAPLLPEQFWVTCGDVLFDRHLVDCPAPVMQLTSDTTREPPNYGRYLDAGLYHVNRSKPSPKTWMWQVSDTPTWTINTREQLGATVAHLR